MQGETTSQDSHGAAFLFATFFLIVPVVLLICIARRQPTPAEEYQRALHETAQPDLSQISHSLFPVNLNEPITVVTWTRHEYLSSYTGQNSPGDRDIWVTVASRLRPFCQEYVRSHSADARQLTLRLEQRLGLPPGSSNDTFVELEVKAEDLRNRSRFFRPCFDPSVDNKSCKLAPPLKPAELRDDLNDPKKRQVMEARYWFFNNYYKSFPSSKQGYPWTSLGYTFDWARKSSSNEMERFGESEFIIRAGTPIRFLSSRDTAAFCTPQ